MTREDERTWAALLGAEVGTVFGAEVGIVFGAEVGSKPTVAKVLVSA